MSLFARRGTGARNIRKRFESDLRALDDIAEGAAGEAADGSFDLHGFAIEAFERTPTPDIEWLVDHGFDGHEFYNRELSCNWRDLTREQRAAKLASFVRFANLLDRTDDDDTAHGVSEMRATVRTKVILLASAYDMSYDESYRRRIARNPRSFGDYELPGRLAGA